jgi:mono/diheme cytochrome c family protein
VLAFVSQQAEVTEQTPDSGGQGIFEDEGKYQPSVATGLKLYRSRCTVCHGETGEGKIGPSINNQAVLSIVSNEFLHDTIVRGRPGTAMPAGDNFQRRSLPTRIVLLRSWQTQPAKELPDIHVQGDPRTASCST